MFKSIKAYKQDNSYHSLCTSAEIIKAIETLAGDDIRDETSAAYKMWVAPTVTEDGEIADLAWSYAEDEVDTLYWGNNVAFKR